MSVPVRRREVETPVGPAGITVRRPPGARGTLVLGHGAGGARWSADILAVTAAVVDRGWCVALVDQPWRLAGRRLASPPARLDTAWVAVLAALASGRARLPEPLVAGGRSAGARVACRTAAHVGAGAVLCLSFPLYPPGRPGRSRAAELRLPAASGMPLRVIQGERDPFGSPGQVAAVLGRDDLVAAVPGSHSLEAHPGPVAEAALGFLAALG